MAGIDKFFLNESEYDQIINWIIEKTGKLSSRKLYEFMISMDLVKKDEYFCVIRTSSKLDKFLKKHCKLKFIQNRLNKMHKF